MRGVRRDDRELVEQLLRDGVAPVKISKEHGIPLSTITTWLKVLRKEKKEKISFSSKRVGAIYTAKSANSGEARIMNIILPFVDEEISDSDFMKLENLISKELKQIASELL